MENSAYRGLEAVMVGSSQLVRGIRSCGFVVLIGMSGLATVATAGQGPQSQLEDWKRSLTLFVQHVEGIRTNPDGAKKVPVLDNALGIGIMNSLGGCTAPKPDATFGPVVEFEGAFSSVKSLEPDRNNLKSKYGLDLSFEKTTPGTIIYLYPAEASLVDWQTLEKGAKVRFRAELNCLMSIQLGGGVGYSSDSQGCGTDQVDDRSGSALRTAPHNPRLLQRTRKLRFPAAEQRTVMLPRY